MIEYMKIKVNLGGLIMSEIKVGARLPEELLDTVPEGISGSFSDKLSFILKMEDLTEADIILFNNSGLSFDLLELDMFKDKIGNIYAFSVLVDGFIDNSEVLVDFRVSDIESVMPKTFKSGNGLDVEFILCDEEDMVLALREFKLSKVLSEIVSKKAYEQNSFVAQSTEKNTDYIVLAFNQIFGNEPEKNLELYSVGRCIIK